MKYYLLSLLILFISLFFAFYFLFYPNYNNNVNEYFNFQKKNSRIFNHRFRNKKIKLCRSPNNMPPYTCDRLKQFNNKKKNFNKNRNFDPLNHYGNSQKNYFYSFQKNTKNNNQEFEKNYNLENDPNKNIYQEMNNTDNLVCAQWDRIWDNEIQIPGELTK